MGMALANGRTCVDAAIYPLVKKIGMDLLPVQRMMVLRELWSPGRARIRSRMVEHYRYRGRHQYSGIDRENGA